MGGGRSRTPDENDRLGGDGGAAPVELTAGGRRGAGGSVPGTADASAGVGRPVLRRRSPRIPWGARRVLATVLFFDVVGSTLLASGLGDSRWTDLLVRMRRAVRKELRRSGGREQDFSGDGFLAVFSEPAAAVRAAVSIIAALHALGLEVRCGVHAGECEVIDGKLRGIAVHIGARVMALAGAADVFVTGTVRDLVVGSGIRFEDVGVYELKGVEGTWLVYRTVEVDGERVERPLPAETASTAISALNLGHRRRRRFGVIAAAVLGVTGLALAVALLTLPAGSAAARFGTNSVVRIDPRRGRVVTVVRDPFAVRDHATYVFASRGTLWDWDNNYGFIRRDMQSGAVLATIHRKTVRPLPSCPFTPAWDVALGTIWLTCSSVPNGGPPEWLFRLDELSFRHLATVRLPPFITFASAGWGLGAYWVVDAFGRLVRVDNATDRTSIYQTPVAAPGSCSNPPWYSAVVGPVVSGHALWFAQCNPNELVRFDPATGRGASFVIPQEVAWILTVPAFPDEVWLFDPYGGTLTPFNTRLKRMGEPIALPGKPQSTAVGGDAIWVAAGNVIDRVDPVLPVGNQVTTLPMPRGLWASSIADDPATDTIWVTNNTYAKRNPQWAGPSGP